MLHPDAGQLKIDRRDRWHRRGSDRRVDFVAADLDSKVAFASLIDESFGTLEHMAAMPVDARSADVRTVRTRSLNPR